MSRRGAGRPRKQIDKRMKPISVTLLPSHHKYLNDTAEELSQRLGTDISISAVVRALIRHAHDNPPKDWKTE